MLNGLEIDEFGNRFWYKDNKPHREDGPAVEFDDGFKEYYLNISYFSLSREKWEIIVRDRVLHLGK